MTTRPSETKYSRDVRRRHRRKSSAAGPHAPRPTPRRMHHMTGHGLPARLGVKYEGKMARDRRKNRGTRAQQEIRYIPASAPEFPFVALGRCAHLPPKAGLYTQIDYERAQQQKNLESENRGREKHARCPTSQTDIVLA